MVEVKAREDEVMLVYGQERVQEPAILLQCKSRPGFRLLIWDQAARQFIIKPIQCFNKPTNLTHLKPPQRKYSK